MENVNIISTIDVIKWVMDHLLSIMVFFSIFIEFTPIKINPISFLSNLFFKQIRSDVDTMRVELNKNIDSIKTDLSDQINELKKENEELKKSIENIERSKEMDEMSKIRWETIEFSNSLENGQLHIRDEYRHILDGNIRYHELIQKYNLTNGLFDDEYNKVKNHYEKSKDSTSVYF